MDDDLKALEAVAGHLRQLEHERDALTAEQDRFITALRDAGATWAQINRACGKKNMQLVHERRLRRAG